MWNVKHAYQTNVSSPRSINMQDLCRTFSLFLNFKRLLHTFSLNCVHLQQQGVVLSQFQITNEPLLTQEIFLEFWSHIIGQQSASFSNEKFQIFVVIASFYYNTLFSVQIPNESLNSGQKLNARVEEIIILILYLIHTTEFVITLYLFSFISFPSNPVQRQMQGNHFFHFFFFFFRHTDR